MFRVGAYAFEVVDSFRYLGIPINGQGSVSTVLASIHQRAAVALAKLCEVVGALKWDTPWTRLVLFDVYVRSCLTFGAPVWAPQALRDHYPRPAPALEQLSVLHRRGLRLLTGIPVDIRVAVLHAATCRAPLSIPLGKAVWRYFARLDAG